MFSGGGITPTSSNGPFGGGGLGAAASSPLAQQPFGSFGGTSAPATTTPFGGGATTFGTGGGASTFGGFPPAPSSFGTAGFGSSSQGFGGLGGPSPFGKTSTGSFGAQQQQFGAGSEQESKASFSAEAFGGGGGQKVQRSKDASSSKAIVVSRLPPNVDEQSVTSAFQSFGSIRNVKVARQPGRPPIAFVNFEDSRSAQRAARETNGKDMLGSGKPLQVVVQQPRGERVQQLPQQTARATSPSVVGDSAPAAAFCLKIQPLPPNCHDDSLRRVLEQNDASAGLASVKTIHRDGRAYGWANYSTKRDADSAANKVEAAGDTLFPGFSAPIHCSVRPIPSANGDASPQKSFGGGFQHDNSSSSHQQQQQTSDAFGGGDDDYDDDEEIPPDLDDDALYAEDVNAAQHRTAVFNKPAPAPASKGDSMTRTIRVDKLPHDVTEARLKSTFATFGKVSMASIQQSNGYALVMFDDAASAKLAATELNGVDAFASGTPLECRVCSSAASTTSSQQPRKSQSVPPPTRPPATPFRARAPAAVTSSATQPGPHQDVASMPKAAIVGTCMLMCPQAEIDERVRHNELDEWERPDDGVERNEQDMRIAVRKLAVKRYKRSDAGSVQNVPEIVRPPLVLRATLDHLEAHVVSHQPFGGVGIPDDSELSTYMFLWNRFRAIRKDFILQNYTNGGLVDGTVVDVFERMARYFVAMERRMALHPEWREGPAHGKHNAESLSETLTALVSFYDMAHARGLNDEILRHEAELTAYYILFFDREQSAEVGGLMQNLALQRPSVYAAAEIRTAAELRNSRTEGDYARFFALARSAPYLVRCLLVAKEATDVRASALVVMGKVYAKGERYPASRLAKVLGFNSTREACDAAREAGYRVTRRQVYFHQPDEDDEFDENENYDTMGNGESPDSEEEDEDDDDDGLAGKTGLFLDVENQTTSYASLADVMSPTSEELAALAERRRMAALVEREAAEAAKAADRAKRALAAAAAAQRRRAAEAAEAARKEREARIKAEREAAAKAETERLAREAAEREAAVKREEERLAREAEEKRRRAEAEERELLRLEEERRVREARERQARLEAEELRRRQEEAERLRLIAEENERRRIEALNERKAIAWFKRATLRRLARSCFGRRDRKHLDAKLAAAVWLRVWHSRAAIRVTKRRCFAELVASFGHQVPWQPFSAKKRSRSGSLGRPPPRYALFSYGKNKSPRLIIDVGLAVSPLLAAEARKAAAHQNISTPPDTLWKLAAIPSLSTDIVSFESKSKFSGARVCVGVAPAHAGIAVVCDTRDVLHLAQNVAPTLRVRALAVVSLAGVDTAPLRRVSGAFFSQIAVADVSDIDQVLRWLVRQTVSQTGFIRALSAADFLPQKALIHDGCGVSDFNALLLEAAEAVESIATRDAEFEWDEPMPEFIESGVIARGALVSRPDGALEAFAPLPVDWLDRTRRCAKLLRQTVISEDTSSPRAKLRDARASLSELVAYHLVLSQPPEQTKSRKQLEYDGPSQLRLAAIESENNQEPLKRREEPLLLLRDDDHSSSRRLKRKLQDAVKRDLSADVKFERQLSALLSGTSGSP